MNKLTKVDWNSLHSNSIPGLDGKDDEDTLYDRWRAEQDERERQEEGPDGH